MKKILILVILLTTYSNIFALLTQGNWRWRNDDGTETSATWKAAENTSATLTTVGEVWRLRLELYNSTGGSYPFFDTLQYATSTLGPWTNVDTAAGSNPFMIAGTSAFVTQDEATTSQLTGIVPYTFSAGKIMVDSMVLKNLNLANSQLTEIEWALRSTLNILPNTTYYFRQVYGSSVQLGAGMTYPSLTTAAVLPVKLTGFTVNREDKKIKLQWTVALEQNSDHFEVQRSSDGRTWKTIATVRSHGTSSESNTYMTFDENPLDGINYYLIKQYDVDGHFYLSDVRLIKMLRDAKSIVVISPNPSHSGISFSLANQVATNVEAILTNTNGNIIHREIINNVQANAINKLNLKYQPAPGIYILKFRGNGLSESVKVVIE